MMDIQKPTVSVGDFIRYEVTLTYRVVVEAPSEVNAVMDARYIVEQNAYDDGPPEPVVTVRAEAPMFWQCVCNARNSGTKCVDCDRQKPDGFLHGDVDAVRAARAVYNAPCVNCGEPHRKHPNARCAMWVGTSAGAANQPGGAP